VDEVDENKRTWPGDVARGEIEVVAEELVWEHRAARLYQDRVRVPGGDDGDDASPAEQTQIRLAHGAGESDGVVIVPVAEDGHVLLVRQFRHPVRMWLRELPRGSARAGEPAADAARRELREELGCEVQQIWPLGRVVNDSGQLSGIPYLFVARVAEGATPARESGEAIDRVLRYRFTALRAACERGDVVDSFTLAAVLRAAPHFDGDDFVWRDGLAPRDPIR
jgi:8-oxo-dGTP pyrophosphatase MutT (NUDIX family)